VPRLERLGCGAARHSLEHRCFDFEETTVLQESANLAHDRDALMKDRSRLLVSHQIEIALPIAGFDVLQTVPFFGQRTQRFRENLKPGNLQARLARLGEEARAFHADEIAEIEQVENLHRFGADLFGMEINLDSSGGIAQIDEMAFPHVAVRRNPAGHAKDLAFLEFGADLANWTSRIKSRTKRLNVTGPQSLHF
jgi:hypothetical protein